jgi:hypothetical protein
MNTKIAGAGGITGGIILAFLGGIATIIAALKPSPACELRNNAVGVQICNSVFDIDYNSQNQKKTN